MLNAHFRYEDLISLFCQLGTVDEILGEGSIFMIHKTHKTMTFKALFMEIQITVKQWFFVDFITSKT